MTDNTELPTHRLVYLGGVTLSDKKTGERWGTEEMAAKAEDLETLLRTGNPFGKSKRSFTVGAVYDMRALLGDDGRPESIVAGSASYRSMLDTTAVQALTLRQKGIDAKEAAKKAEAKARRDGGDSLDSLLDQVARIVARAPFTNQETILQGFTTDVRRRTLAIWRAGQ